MSKPFFSVIIPAYNSEEYIRKALDSIRQQSFENYELIVACDSCTDHTSDVAREYTDKVLTVCYGLDGLTRNAGLDVAKGKWVLFLDDDDWFLHEFVFAQIADVLDGRKEDALLFSYIKRGVGYQKQSPDDVHVGVWSKCWRREFIGGTRFSNRHYWSDTDFHNRLMRMPHKFIYWDMPMMYYNFMRKGSQTDMYFSGDVAQFGFHEHAITKDVYERRIEQCWTL